MRGKDSVGDREREEPSTPIREASAVTDRRETEETEGGGKELEARADEVTNTGVWCGKTDEREGTTTMKGEEADAKVWSTTGEERNTKHALWQAEGQETSMHPEKRQRVTEDSGRVGPLRGEYEEEDGNNKSWHDAREDGWEIASYGEAKNEAETKPVSNTSV